MNTNDEKYKAFYSGDILYSTEVVATADQNIFNSLKRIRPGLLKFCIAIISFGYLSGCHQDISDPYDNPTNKEPIYLSYDELRSSVKTTNDADLTDFGKVALYQDYLFINSRNQGIHIYDNRDTSNPVFVTFINIPGNIDIAIKNGFLYADSYVDLVVIDLSDKQALKESFRIEDVFPYNAYQNIPDGIYLQGLDQRKGVVVGYKEKQE